MSNAIIEELHSHIKDQSHLVKHNTDLFNIYEGDLLRYVLEELRNQISLESFKIAEKRVAPINILIKLIDKLSKIYQQSPTRHVEGGKDKDDELLTYYEESMNINNIMNSSNEFMNLFKNNLIQPYLHNGAPKLRSIASNAFTVYSHCAVDPTQPTYVITFHKDSEGMPIYYAYSDTHFFIFDDERNIRKDLMLPFNNPEGINEVGKIPFVYVNRSKNLLIPKIDTDTKCMTLLLPVMLSDLNFAVMMQAFSIIYGIDVDHTGMKMSPSAFWNFKTDPDTETTPQIGVLKPQVEIQATMELIQAEIGLWLQTRGIKPGSVGTLTSENFASGISKMIDEMDTSEERQKQVTIYQNVEKELWDLNINYMHPYWRKQGLETTLDWTPGVKVRTDFSEQLPLLNRGDIVTALQAEVSAGFISKRRAIKKLNPRMSHSEIDELLEEMELENG